MGNAWNIKTATDEIMKVIISMQNGVRAFDYKKVLVHKCGIKCPLIETLYEARKKEELQNNKRSQTAQYVKVRMENFTTNQKANGGMVNK